MPATRLSVKKSDLTRRDFLSLLSKTMIAVSGLLGLGGMLHFLTAPAEEPPQTQFDLGPAGNYPLGSRTFINQSQAVIFHTPQGYRALSTVCPHLGCLVNPDQDGFLCPCHGSRYDKNGKVMRGPSKQDLNELRLEENPSGNLILYTD
jgi:cytochrome b6-f complex iron-sulfur subunit